MELFTNEQKEEIARRYRSGEKMEKISDAMELDLPALSRYITKSGLAKERYGHQNWSSPGTGKYGNKISIGTFPGQYVSDGRVHR